MRTGYTLALRPDAVEDPEALFKHLEDSLGDSVSLDKAKFFTAVEKKGDPYEEIAVRVPKETGEQLLEEKLPGLIVVRDKWRFYPGDSLASQVLGFVGFGPNNPNSVEGVYGLEKYWNDTLSRSDDDLYVNFFAEVFGNLQALVANNASVREGDVITTINADVQSQLESVIRKVQSTYQAQLTGGVVMDPKTGEIIAMASTPSFNPNEYASATSTALYRNPVVENEYELGSIMKPITMASGIDAGVVTPESTYHDPGCVKKGGITICNYDSRSRGYGVSMQEVLNQSLNTGVVHVVDELGEETFAKYLHAFGMGEETGVDLPNEVPGHIAAYETGSEADYASASFGQGFAVTPLAMARALAVLANGGMLVTPHVAKAVHSPGGITRELYHPDGGRVISKDTAETISRMLVTVYDDALLVGAVKKEHYSIAAKTGTAQMANPNGGGYYTDRYLHSFFGYFPAYDARFIILLFTVDPRGEQYASHTLTYPFVDLVDFLINYYDIPPDR